MLNSRATQHTLYPRPHRTPPSRGDRLNILRSRAGLGNPRRHNWETRTHSSQGTFHNRVGSPWGAAQGQAPPSARFERCTTPGFGGDVQAGAEVDPGSDSLTCHRKRIFTSRSPMRATKRRSSRR